MNSDLRSHRVLEVVGSDIDQHPAALAWCGLDPANRLPVSIDVLKQRRNNIGGLKAAVYRLRLTDEPFGTVIAKRCKADVAAKETLIYTTVLPRLSVSSIQAVGMVREASPPYAWLFLEDVGNTPFLRDSMEHQALKGTWLGNLHSRASLGSESFGLPERGPQFYLQSLRASSAAIGEHLERGRLSATDGAIYEGVLSLLGRILPNWSDIERECTRLPRTLIHGDLVGKNMCVVEKDQGTVLVPFDWQTAGWGSPATDLAAGFGPGESSRFLEAYLAVVEKRWAGVDLNRVRSQARVGKLFRTIVSIHWDAARVEQSWPEKMAHRMDAYRNRLLRCLAPEAIN